MAGKPKGVSGNVGDALCLSTFNSTIQRIAASRRLWTLCNTDSLNLPHGLRMCRLLSQDLFRQDLSIEAFANHVHAELVGCLPSKNRGLNGGGAIGGVGRAIEKGPPAG